MKIIGTIGKKVWQCGFIDKTGVYLAQDDFGKFYAVVPLAEERKDDFATAWRKTLIDLSDRFLPAKKTRKRGS